MLTKNSSKCFSRKRKVEWNLMLSQLFLGARNPTFRFLAMGFSPTPVAYHSRKISPYQKCLNWPVILKDELQLTSYIFYYIYFLLKLASPIFRCGDFIWIQFFMQIKDAASFTWRQCTVWAETKPWVNRNSGTQPCSYSPRWITLPDVLIQWRILRRLNKVLVQPLLEPLSLTMPTGLFPDPKALCLPLPLCWTLFMAHFMGDGLHLVGLPHWCPAVWVAIVNTGGSLLAELWELLLLPLIAGTHRCGCLRVTGRDAGLLDALFLYPIINVTKEEPGIESAVKCVDRATGN